jgi:hypothetical protein
MAIFLHFKTTFYYERDDPSPRCTYTFISLMQLSEGVFDVFPPEIATGKDTASCEGAFTQKNIMFFPCEKKKTRKNNRKRPHALFFPHSFKGQQRNVTVFL